MKFKRGRITTLMYAALHVFKNIFILRKIYTCSLFKNEHKNNFKRFFLPLNISCLEIHLSFSFPSAINMLIQQTKINIFSLKTNNCTLTNAWTTTLNSPIIPLFPPDEIITKKKNHHFSLLQQSSENSNKRAKPSNLIRINWLILKPRVTSKNSETG